MKKLSNESITVAIAGIFKSMMFLLDERSSCGTHVPTFPAELVTSALLLLIYSYTVVRIYYCYYFS
jgi:hypothetical protein